MLTNQKYIPNELKIKINTSIPGFQTIKYTPSMTLKDETGLNSVRFNPLVKLDKSVIERVPKNLRIKEFFNKGLFESLINSHGMVHQKTLKEATYKGYVDHNIKVTLDTIFPIGSVIYVNREPYVIADVQWRKGDWKIDTKQKSVELDPNKIRNPYLYTSIIRDDIISGERQLQEIPPELMNGPNYVAPVASGPKPPTPETQPAPTNTAAATAPPSTALVPVKRQGQDVPLKPAPAAIMPPTPPSSSPPAIMPPPPPSPQVTTPLAIMPPTTPSSQVSSPTKIELLDDDDEPGPDPEIRLLTGGKSSTSILRSYFSNPNYYNLINNLFSLMSLESKRAIKNIQQKTTTININQTSTNLSISAYDNSVESLSVAYNEGKGDCFFLAVAQGLNYNNFRNPKKKINSADGYGRGNRIFTQEYLRRLVYNYLNGQNGDLGNKISAVTGTVEMLNNDFLQELNDRSYNRGNRTLSNDDYMELVRHIYYSPNYSNFLVSKPQEPPVNDDEYERPFGLINRDNLKSYILSPDYWANEVAITALCNELNINVIIIKNENDRLTIPYGNLLTTDCDSWNRYLFLYNTNEHYELLIFRYITLKYNKATRKQIQEKSYYSLFERNDISLPPPLYILFLLYGSKYVSLIDKTQFSFFPNIFATIHNSFTQIVEVNNSASLNFLTKFNEYFPSRYIEGLIKKQSLDRSEELETNVEGPEPPIITNKQFKIEPYETLNDNTRGGSADDNNHFPNSNKPPSSFIKKEENIDSSKIGYYISIDMELQKGTSLSPEELSNAKCNRKWNSVRKAFADFTGMKYVIPPIYNNKTKKQNQSQNQKQNQKQKQNQGENQNVTRSNTDTVNNETRKQNVGGGKRNKTIKGYKRR
jgi:hypothetical protein